MTHGGNRKGAGRPKLPAYLKKNARSIKLPEWLWHWIDNQPDTNRALIIEKALIVQHGICVENETARHLESER